MKKMFLCLMVFLAMSITRAFADTTDGIGIETIGGAECAENMCVSSESTPENIVCVPCDPGAGNMPEGSLTDDGNPNGNPDDTLRATQAKVQRAIGGMSQASSSSMNNVSVSANSDVLKTKNSASKLDAPLKRSISNVTSGSRVKVKTSY